MEITGIMIKSIELLDIIEEAKDTFTYKFNIPKGTVWEAGTNAHLVANGSDTNYAPNREFMRHMSICSLPEEGYIGFSTRAREGGSTFKRNLRVSKVGDKLQLFGLKNRLPLHRNNRPVVLISMGVGIATMRPMILEYAKDQQNIPQLVNINIDRAVTEIYQNELAALQIPNFENIYVNSRADLHNSIENTLQLTDAEYHIVGSDEFLMNIGAFLLKKGVADDCIKLDKKENRAKQMIEEMKEN